MAELLLQMPELPEAETFRSELEPLVVGKRIERAEITLPRMVRRYSSPGRVEELIRGRRIGSLKRRGKALVFGLDGHPMIIHLGMSGNLFINDASDPLPKHVHAVFSLEGGKQIRFQDQRQFGEIIVEPETDWSRIPDLAKYGPEPLGKDLTLDYLRKGLARRAAPVKAALMDQGFVAGIGNIYSDEILFAAEIRPLRPASSLSGREVERLLQAIPKVLRRAIECRGTSGNDESYVDAFGALGAFQHELMVYQRAGQPCRACGAPIERAVLQKRGVHFCPKCQE